MTDLEAKKMQRELSMIRNVMIAPSALAMGAMAIVAAPVVIIFVMCFIAFVVQAVVHAFTW